MTCADEIAAVLSMTPIPGFEQEDDTGGNPAERMNRSPDAAERIRESGLI